MIENRGKVTIKSQKEFTNSLDDATDKSIKEQSDTHAQYLKSCLRTDTDGELHVRVIQTDYDEVMELTRAVIYCKGRNRNPNRPIDFDAKALSPHQANKASDFDKILTECRETRQNVEEDPTYNMDDETMQTILLKIMRPAVREGHERAARAREARGRLLQFGAGFV